MKKNILKIFTDGSCKGNPGAGGWAAVLLEGEAKKPFAVLRGGESATTNNRMEMIAVIEALRYIQKNHLQNNPVNVFSDSNLLVQTLMQGWKRKKNLDLWEELDSLNEELEVEYIWVKAHADNKWNNECDEIAVAESAKSQKKYIAAKSYGKQTKLF